MKKPTIFQHYAFVSNDGGFNVLISSLKTTAAMFCMTIAYITKYVTRENADVHYIVAHTDKSRAAKALQSGLYYRYVHEFQKACQALADQAYGDITGVPGLKELVSLKGHEIIQFYDQSTVPRDDSGEEVPQPGNTFYNAHYQEYRRIVLDKFPHLDVPKYLMNGIFRENPFDRIEKENGLSTGEIIDWFLTKKVIDYKDHKGLTIKESAICRLSESDDGRGQVIDDFYRVSPAVDINNKNFWKNISVRELNKVADESVENQNKFRKQVCRTLVSVAKNGYDKQAKGFKNPAFANTGNITYGTEGPTFSEAPGNIPRMTDLAFMAVGGIDPNGKMRKVVNLMQIYLKISFSFSQSKVASEIVYGGQGKVHYSHIGLSKL